MRVMSYPDWYSQRSTYRLLLRYTPHTMSIRVHTAYARKYVQTQSVDRDELHIIIRFYTYAFLTSFYLFLLLIKANTLCRQVGRRRVERGRLDFPFLSHNTRTRAEM